MRILLTALFMALFFVACSGQSGSDRTCEITPGSFQPITDRISLAQCGDGSVCIGACGGTQDSNNPDNSTNDSNNPDNSSRENTTIVNPTPTPRFG